MAWWNSSWTKKQSITLTGGASGAQNSYQVKLTVPWDSDMKADFSDLRFTNGAEDTLLDAWMESHTASTSADIWVEFPTTPANTVEQTYYMYYGKADAVSDWDILSTFIDADDFEDGDTTNAGDLFVTSSNKASTTQARSGTYSISNVSTSELLSQSLSSLALGAHFIDYYIYILSTTNRIETLWIVDSGGDSPNTDSGMYLKLDGGTMYAYSGSWVDTTITYTTGWHKLSVRQMSTTFDLVFDAQHNEGISNRNTLSNINKIGFGSSSNNNAQTMYYDDFCVRKYAANPPTYAFGAEESAPTGGNSLWYFNMLKRRNS